MYIKFQNVSKKILPNKKLINSNASLLDLYSQID